MAERLTVTPAEASSVLINRILGGSYFSEEASNKMVGEEDYFDLQEANRWSVIFQDAQRSQLLIDSVTRALEF